MHQHECGTARGRLGDHHLQLGVAGTEAIRRIIDADRGWLGFHIGSVVR